MSTTTVSTRGQITLPARLRNATGIKPRDRVLVEAVDRTIIIRAAPDLMQLYGFLGKALPEQEERISMAHGIERHIRLCQTRGKTG